MYHTNRHPGEKGTWAGEKRKKIAADKETTETDEEVAYETQLNEEMVLDTNSQSANKFKNDDQLSDAEYVKKNWHVLVKYKAARKTEMHCASAVIAVNNEKYEINFWYTGKGTAELFSYPEIEDGDSATLESIVMLLGDQLHVGRTARPIARVMFQGNFSGYNIQRQFSIM